MVYPWTHGIPIFFYINLFQVLVTHGFFYINLFQVLRTPGIDVDSWYRHGLMVKTWIHGIPIDLCYSISSYESHMYERAK